MKHIIKAHSLNNINDFDLTNYFLVEMYFVNNERNIDRPIEETQIDILNTLNEEYGFFYTYLSSTFKIYIHNSHLVNFLNKYVDSEHPFMLKQSFNKTVPWPLFSIRHIIKYSKINLSKELLEQIIISRKKFEENIWFDLVENTSFVLTVGDFEFLKSHVDFNPFSSLVNFDWSTEFLLNNFDKLNWEKLSSNPGLKWNENLIETFLDKWLWKPGYERQKSICNNESIYWSISIFDKYKDRIDLYDFITHAKIDPNIIIKYYELFLGTKTIIHNCHRAGDDKEWDELELIYVVEYAHNPHFILTKELITFAENIEIKVMTCGSYFNYPAKFKTQLLINHWKDRWDSKQ